MHISVSDEQKLIRQVARDALADFVTFEQLGVFEESDDGLDSVTWKRVTDLGWPAISVPATFGGQEIGTIEIGLLLEEVGRAGWASPLLDSVVAGLLLRAPGCRETAVAGAVLEHIAAGGIVALAGLSGEAGPVVGGRTGSAISIAAQRQPVPWAHLADYLIVVARDTHEPDRSEVVVVRTSDPGVTIRPARSLDNERSGVVTLDVEVACDHQVASLPTQRDLDGFRTPYWALNAALMLGTARRLLELTVEYTKVRHQFGRALASLPTVQHACADMAIESDAASLATYDALHRLQTGTPALAAAATAAHASGSAAANAAVRAAQLHGAIGFMQEYHLQYFFRRAKAQQIRLGSLRRQRDALARILLPALDRAGAALPLEGLGASAGGSDGS